MSAYWRWDAGELAGRYQQKFGMDVSRFLSDDEISLARDPETGVWMFRGCTPGDGSFYEQLSEFPYSYMEEKWEFSEALKMLPSGRRDVSILEVGCGHGAFLDQAREAGFTQLVGLELNESAAAACRRNGHRVRCCSTSELAQDGQRFDFVFAFQVLEHTEDPKSFLRELTLLTSADGQLVVSTPNKEAFPKRYRWDLLDLPPHHMSRWDRASYRTITARLGLELVSLRYEPLARYHHHFFTSSFLEKYPAHGWRRRLAKLAIKTGFALYPLKRWIRGHSMLATMRHRAAELADKPAQFRLSA